MIYFEKRVNEITAFKVMRLRYALNLASNTNYFLIMQKFFIISNK